ncbi:FAD-binding domain-containing protein [Yoonia sp.]|uniref:FAD-binding domain-containing protein n=1 Tax=Yoonia sp. TaxID=2212373 RepID=UPI0025DB928A|nr:FAD-binding domain-containing protein [Yoonia sp.]
MFDPTYTAAQQRLAAFVPHAGRDYASARNFDSTAHVSTLSPYIRHRIITEKDVLRAVLARHSPQAAEKFIQEIFWRTYWKGWLERHPAVWTAYKTDLHAALHRVQSESGMRRQWDAACHGQTGIDGFDHWAQELVKTGYLHNHARMWFASIWIFTLRLPWTLGADFFLRHLHDGDAASNTLSWRWVGGLHTVGKTYLARPDTIARYTQGRFHPTGLATQAHPLDQTAPPPPPGPVPRSDQIDPSLRTGLLLTPEDLSPGWLLDPISPAATATLHTPDARRVTTFAHAAMADCTARYGHRLGPVTPLSSAQISQWARDNNLGQIVTSYPPTGPTADTLASQDIARIIRPYDRAAWPHATHGFFRFKGLCCTNRLMAEVPLSLDRLIPRSL